MKVYFHGITLAYKLGPYIQKEGMMISLKYLTSLILSFALIACESSDVTEKVPGDMSVPSKSEIDDAKARLGLSSEAMGNLHAILVFLGVIPTYTCGEPRSNFAGKLPNALQTQLSNSVISLNASDPTVDVISLNFAESGTALQGHTFTGNLLITTSGGSDRFELAIDARNTKLNGRTLNTTAGYGTCSDSTTYWAKSNGPLSGKANSYNLDAFIGKKAGMPLIGSTTLLINATGAVTQNGKVDQLTLKSIDYKMGKLLPRSGTILLETSSGHRISADFSDDTPIKGQVKVKIDSKSPVSIPLPGF